MLLDKVNVYGPRQICMLCIRVRPRAQHANLARKSKSKDICTHKLKSLSVCSLLHIGVTRDARHLCINLRYCSAVTYKAEVNKLVHRRSKTDACNSLGNTNKCLTDKFLHVCTDGCKQSANATKT